jgi:hypothetical protein
MRLFLLFAVGVNGLLAQESNDLLSQYKKLGLPEAAGPVPVMYSPLAEQRALRYQKALTAAAAWYNEQLKMKVHIVLAVVDKDTWEKAEAEPGGTRYPMPHNHWRTSGEIAFVVLPARMEDFPGSALVSKDPDLLAEAISFHEAGHDFAKALGIESGNRFVHELIANIFMAGYIGAGHPEFAFMTAGRPSGFPPQRYTSLADLDYLYGQVGQENYAWFQLKLGQLASLIVEAHDFSAVIDELKLAFPATDIRPLPVGEILGRLEKIHPGLIKMATDLAGPSTLLPVTPSECPTAAATGAASILVVRNNTGAELTVKEENGETVEVPTGEFREVHGKSGQKVMLPANRCLVFASEPRLAVLAK